jgi:AcrR family transcriptional regulator
MRGKRKGIDTHGRILRRAVQLASVEGLEGLSVGRLAAALGLSKAGLFAHFGSKEALQLAVIEEARRIFEEKVVSVADDVPEGLPRLIALQRNWIDYLRAETFRGGCFFAAASAEFDGRPGPVRARIAAVAGRWRDLLEAEARTAQAQGHIDATSTPARLAFLLHAITSEANWAHQLLRDTESFDRARETSESCLKSVATAEGLRATKARRVLPAHLDAGAA